MNLFEHEENLTIKNDDRGQSCRIKCYEFEKYCKISPALQYENRLVSSNLGGNYSEKFL